MQKNITLLHISDLHFADETKRLSDLARKEGISSKRIAGWLNHHLNRKGEHHNANRKRLLARLGAMDWDYLIVSGDLTTLALRQEFEEARRSLDPLLQKGPILFTPGNHDRYVRDAVEPDLMAAVFSDCFPFNRQAPSDQGFRCLELSRTVVLIEIESACPRSHVSSRGRIDTDLEACGDFIDGRYEDHLKIVIGHYPALLPPEVKEGFLHRLANRNRLLQFLINHRIDLYLHGHIHKTWEIRPPDNPGLVCLNAGGCCRQRSGPWSGFHQIVITEQTFEINRIHLSSKEMGSGL